MKTNLSILFCALLIFSCTEKQPEETNKPIPVRVREASYSLLSLPIYRSGILAASSEARLSFKTGGIIHRIRADEGDRVKQGQILASLNLAEIQAQVKLAESGYDKAFRDLKRIDKLFQDSVATLEQKQDLETAVQVAEARLRIAEFNLRHSRIIAPADGRILKRFAEENELIAPGSPVFFFGSFRENWIIRIGVTDRDIVTLTPGDSASVSFDAYPATTFEAYVSEISESADPQSGTFEIELTLEEQEQKFISGFVAKAEIYPAKTRPYILLPLGALVEADKNTGYVFTIDDSSERSVRLPVKTGQILNDHVIIRSGIKPGTKIITEGAAYLTDRSAVRIVE